MELHSRNISRLLAECPEGLGWRAELPGVTLEGLCNTSGAFLTGATTPLREKNIGDEIQANFATGVTVATLRFKVPRDYDWHNKDAELKIQMKLAAAGSTNAPVCTLTATAREPDGTAKLSYSAGAATGEASTDVQVLTWDLAAVLDGSSIKLKPGDTVTLTFTFAAHGTDAFYVYEVDGFYSKLPTFQKVRNRNNAYATDQD